MPEYKVNAGRKGLWPAISLGVCGDSLGPPLKGLIYFDRSEYLSQEETFFKKVISVIKLSQILLFTFILSLFFICVSDIVFLKDIYYCYKL